MGNVYGNIDPLVEPMVEYFNSVGLKTRMSCQGHGIPNMSLFWIEFDPSVTEKDIVSFQRSHLNKQGGFPSNGRFVERILAWSTDRDGVDKRYQYIAANHEAADGDLRRWKTIDAVQKYKHYVAKDASASLGISVEEATVVMEKSGVNRLIDDDPMVSTHYPVSDWTDNIRQYITRHMKLIKKYAAC